MVFGAIYNFLIDLFGNFGLIFITGITVITALTSIIGKYIAKPGNKFYEYFEGDSDASYSIFYWSYIYINIYFRLYNIRF